MSLWTELGENVRGILAVDKMRESSDWPETRVKATVAALDRIRAYALEKEHRFAAYESGAESAKYRRMWRDRSRSRVLDFDFVAEGRR